MAAERSYQTLRARYLSALLSGDRREAIRLIMEEGIDRGAPVLEVEMEVIAEAQRAVGDLWEQDRISVAHEHMATAISQLVLAQLYLKATPLPTTGKKVVVACVEGELHEFPARLVADALDLSGFQVRFLGASVPVASLLSLLSAVRPELLALSVTMALYLPALRETVREVRSRLGRGVLIGVGGRACALEASVVQETGADFTAKNARDAVAAARAVALGVRG